MVSQCRPPAHLSTTNHVVLASHRIPFTLDTLCTIQCSTLYVHMPYLLSEPLSFIEKTLPFIIAQCTLSTPVYPCIPRYTLVYPGIPLYTPVYHLWIALLSFVWIWVTSPCYLLTPELVLWVRNLLLLLWVLWLHTSGYCRYCAHRSLQATCHQPIISSVHHQHFFFQLEPQHFCQQSFKCSWHRAHNANVWNM